MNGAYVFDAVRTPRGKGRRSAGPGKAEGGALSEVTPIDLAATVLEALRTRNRLDTAHVDDVLLGIVTPVGEQGADLARRAVLAAGWDVGVPGTQLNRFCASGLEAINLAAAKVMAGLEDVVVAGGVESMSRVPIGSDGLDWLADPERTGFVPQGVSADLLATLDGGSREQLDAYALSSQRRAAEARDRGYFDRSLVPVRVPAGGSRDSGDPGGSDSAAGRWVDRDETIRPETTPEGLAALRSSFARLGAQGFDEVALARYPQLERIEHRHTAGNSSQIVDGAAAVLVGGERAGDRLGLTPRARIVSAAAVGTEPTLMLTGPAPAARKALERAGLSWSDIDLFEVNEAFSAVVLRFLAESGVPSSLVNVNGGAIAMGHPLGATGAMLLGTVVDELERRGLRRGLITMCVGAGMGAATIVERVE